MKYKKLWLFLIILFILPICFAFILCNKSKNDPNIINEFVCDLSPKIIKEGNFVLFEDDLVPKQNINGLNSHFVYDLDLSLAKDRCFVDHDNGKNDIAQELGKIDSYYWDINNKENKLANYEISFFRFLLNPTMKEKLKKIENLKKFIDFYWVYKNFDQNKKQLIVKKDNDFLSTKNCYFISSLVKYTEDINKSEKIYFNFAHNLINEITQSNGFCGVIFKFKGQKKNHSVFIKFLNKKIFSFIEKFTTITTNFNHDLSRLNYFFAIEKIGNDKFEDIVKKIIESDKSSLIEWKIWWGEEKKFPHFIKFIKTSRNDDENKSFVSFIKFDDFASDDKNADYLYDYKIQLELYLDKKIITPQHNSFLDLSKLLSVDGKEVKDPLSRSLFYKTSIVNAYNASFKNIPVLNNNVKLIDNEKIDNSPKRCTYKCIFDPLSLQECYVLKELNEKELDCFFEYKDKNSIYRTKKINRDCCAKGSDGFHHIKFWSKVFGCDFYCQKLKIKFVDFN